MLRFKSFINLKEGSLDQMFNKDSLDSPSNTLFQPRNVSPNPLGEKKKVKGFKESLNSGETGNGDQMPVTGQMNGTNVMPLVTPLDKKRAKIITTIPDSITANNVKECVDELEKGLQKLNDYGHEPINKLMMAISKKHGITGKELHNRFKEKNKTTPDNWIKNKLGAK